MLHAAISNSNTEVETKLFSNLEPSFKNLNLEILLSFRSQLQKSSDETVPIRLWAEKLIRFCTLRLWELPLKIQQKTKSRPEAARFLVELAGFLWDSYIFYKDLRYLNTTLFLKDLKSFPKSKEASLLLKKIESELKILKVQERVVQ